MFTFFVVVIFFLFTLLKSAVCLQFFSGKHLDEEDEDDDLSDNNVGILDEDSAIVHVEGEFIFSFFFLNNICFFREINFTKNFEDFTKKN